MHDARVRALWQATETVHAVVYFAPEQADVYAGAGAKGGWMGYFASRSAAMGAVSPEVVVATFFNFHPERVRRAVPDCWRLSRPDRMLDARRELADLALRRLLGDEMEGDAVKQCGALVREAIEGCDGAGRPLYAAHAGLGWPDEPHLALWHACTLLREHRGDGHVAALTTYSLDGCEANVLLVADGRTNRELQQRFRGWSDDDWDGAAERLAQRGWLDDESELTQTGHEVREQVEAMTDLLASEPAERLGDDRVGDLLDGLSGLDGMILAGGDMTFPNPMGMPRPR